MKLAQIMKLAQVGDEGFGDRLHAWLMGATPKKMPPLKPPAAKSPPLLNTLTSIFNHAPYTLRARTDWGMRERQAYAKNDIAIYKLDDIHNTIGPDTIIAMLELDQDYLTLDCGPQTTKVKPTPWYDPRSWPASRSAYKYRPKVQPTTTKWEHHLKLRTNNYSIDEIIQLIKDSKPAWEQMG